MPGMKNVSVSITFQIKLILFLHHFICASSKDRGRTGQIESPCIIIASLLFISIFSQQSNPHAYSMWRGQSEVQSRRRARVRGEVLPASSVLFVDSSLMQIAIVQNDITYAQSGAANENILC